VFENTKCECGFQNHVGTVLCESCGKPLFDETNEGSLEMRYDGVARRSQKQNPFILDRIWNFFSSVKVAIYMILITLVTSMIGTVFPQQSTFLNFDPATYYKQTYGTIGEIYYKLGLSRTYDSWWFRGLLFFIGTSLVICSLDRVLPLYRALNKQQIRKHLQFILRQKVAISAKLASDPANRTTEQRVEAMAAQLRTQHYRVHTDGTALLAEKNRFSRWGPYILHIGLILFLLATLMRAIPGWHMDNYAGFLEGQTTKIPNTSYYLKNVKFTVEDYSKDEMTKKFQKENVNVIKLYETKATLYQCTAYCDDPAQIPVLQPLSTQNIEVNHPFAYKGLFLYQFDYKLTPMLLSIDPTLANPTTGDVYGTLHLSTTKPAANYQVGPYKLVLKDYYPDFALDGNGNPTTSSPDPHAPAYIFIITGPGLASSGEPYIYFPQEIDQAKFSQDQINGTIGKKLTFSATMNHVQIANYTSYLNIRVDKAMPFIWVGAAVSMLGLIMGFYWQHRRIWLRIDEDVLALGAHTNKNWFGIRKEVFKALDKQGIVADIHFLEPGGKNE